MVLFPSSSLSRLLLAVIVLTTISYLVLNLVSFGGNHWVTYNIDNVRFGLWRVCDTTAPGLCNYWTDQFASNVTSFVFNGEKPGFIRSAQALEIVSLVFYIEAAAFILVGILNFRAFSYKRAFLVAIVLLFLCIVFLSAALGVMSVQGRDGRLSATLGWSWGVGLAGLIVTIVCWITLIGFLLSMKSSSSPSPSSNNAQKFSRSFENPPMVGMWNNNYYPPPVMMPPDPMMFYNEPNPAMYYGMANPPIYSPNEYYFEENPMMYYPNEYYVEQSPSPMMTELARQYFFRLNDAQYERQLLEPYSQYFQQPFTINQYL